MGALAAASRTKTVPSPSASPPAKARPRSIRNSPSPRSGPSSSSAPGPPRPIPPPASSKWPNSNNRRYSSQPVSEVYDLWLPSSFRSSAIKAMRRSRRSSPDRSLPIAPRHDPRSLRSYWEGIISESPIAASSTVCVPGGIWAIKDAMLWFFPASKLGFEPGVTGSTATGAIA